MRVVKNKFVLMILLVTILVVTSKVYAKTSIEIKPSNSSVYTNKTISEFFDESLAMKNVGEGLESDNVDVHMSTNTDWAIVSYFSNSAYGTNGEGKNAGVATTINGKEYLSTNGNATGVMNFGKNSTYASGVGSSYAEVSESLHDNGKSIIENVTNSKYVDIFNWSDAKVIAAPGWYSVRTVIDPGAAYCTRTGLFGFIGGVTGGGNAPFCSGEAKWDTTFRPAIWN